MNHFNTLNGDERYEPPIEWNSQPPTVQFKSRNSPTKNSPVVVATTGILNHCDIYNCGVEVYPSEYPFGYISKYVPDPDNNTTESIDDDEMDQLLEFFHSEHDYDFLDVELQILQYSIVVAPS